MTPDQRTPDPFELPAALMKDGIMRRLNPAWNPSAGCTIGRSMASTQ